MKKKLFGLILCAVALAALMVAAALLTDGILWIILLGILYFALIDALATVIRQLLGEPEPQKRPKEEMIQMENQWYAQRQDPAVMARLRPVGYILAGISFLLIIFGIAGILSYTLHSILCLASTAACVILAAAFPAYFSFNYAEGVKESPYTFHIVNVLIPFFLSLAAGALRALTELNFTDWIAAAEGVMVTAALLAAVLRLTVPELRRTTSTWIGVMFFVVIFGLGVTAPVNYLLSPPPQIETATVTEYHPGGYRSPADYALRLEAGEEIRMIANDGRSYEIGEQIQVERYPGGLGIEYYCYPD